MTKEKQRYLDNKARVAEIQGIELPNRDWNCHHEIGRKEASKLMGKDFDVDQLSNLFFLRIEDHKKLHRRIDLEKL